MTKEMEAKRTRWMTVVAISNTVRGLDLVGEYESILASYLDEPWRAALGRDVAALRDADAAAKVAVLERKAWTARLRDVTRRAWRLAAGARQAVRYRRPIEVALAGAFGVGTKLDPRSVRRVLTALDAAIETATSGPDAAAEAGVTAEIVGRMREVRAELVAADLEQDHHTEAAKAATARRDELQVRVENGLGRIIAVGRMVFADDPTVAGRFASLAPGARGRRATPAPGAEGEATGPPAALAEAAE